MDGHFSHTNSVHALTLLNENRVLAISLPAHTTPLLQPLDVSFFAPLKAGSQNKMNEWRIREHKHKYNIDDLPLILSSCWDLTFSTSNIRAGFKAAGIFPLNENWIEENEGLLTTIELTKTAKFEALLNRTRLESRGESEWLRSCDYLDLATPL